jgi:hypothetical protein
MRWCFVILLLLGGCATSGVCDYDLAANGWRTIVGPPLELQHGRDEGAQWFANERGDLFACHGLKRRGLCGNVYSVYAKQENGSFKEQDIVCTR